MKRCKDCEYFMKGERLRLNTEYVCKIVLSVQSSSDFYYKEIYPDDKACSNFEEKKDE